MVRIIRSVSRGEEVNIDYGFDFYANPKEVRCKRSQTQYFFACQCNPCRGDWPCYNDLVGRPRQLKVRLSPALSEEMERQAAAYQIGMDFLLKLDVATALPVFRDYLMVMNELVEHPDARYIDCEEAYKQCLWLENRGYRPKVPPSSPTSPLAAAGTMAAAGMAAAAAHGHPHGHHPQHPEAALRQSSTTSTLR